VNANKNLLYMSSAIEKMITETTVIKPPNSFDGGGGGGYDGEMDTRLVKVEEFAADAKQRLVKIETRLDHTATKSDVEASTNKIIIWIAGILFVLAGTGITVMTFVLNNAVPKPPSAASVPVAPIILYAQPAPVGPSVPQTKP